jgi:Ca2+-binding RTX toxin-like protein
VQAKAGGINTVQTAVSYTASANVRNVTGTGVANVTLAGNDLDNVITANGGNDTLMAGAGNDTLVSGAGNDLLVGGAGNTTFAYGLGDGMDTLQAGTGTSTVRFGAGIALGNAVIRLTNADGSPCEMVADGGTIHAANPTGASQALSAHLVLLDEHGVVQPGQGMGFTVTMDAKGNITSPISSFHFADGSAAAFTDLLATSQTLRGSDTKGTIATGHNDDVIYAGPYTTEIQLGSGNNTVYGGPQGTLVRGGGGVDHFIGGQGNDTFAGGWGVSVVQGVQGNGNFTAANGPAVLMGGRYGDVLTGGAGNDFLAGGAGDDTITTGSAGAVVAFNKGDGQDTLHLGTGAATLSLGGGISEADLTFTRKGDDLVLGTGSGGAITLAGWYGGTGQHNQLTLQMVEAASKTYDPASSDQLVNRKVETFDFGQLVQQFDAARAANPQLTSWSLMDGLLSAHLAGSDSAALGGDLAFYYGANGNLSGLDLDVAVTTVRDSRFGKSAQGIDNWSGVSRGGDALR